jgi:hypothetical protein
VVSCRTPWFKMGLLVLSSARPKRAQKTIDLLEHFLSALHFVLRTTGRQSCGLEHLRFEVKPLEVIGFFAKQMVLSATSSAHLTRPLRLCESSIGYSGGTRFISLVFDITHNQDLDLLI